MSRNYNTLYTSHLEQLGDPNTTVGGGDELVVARNQVETLRRGGVLGGSRFLELGCGTGRIWTALIDELDAAACTYVGLDVVPDLAARTQERLDGLGLPRDRFSAHWIDGEQGWPYEFRADTVFAFSVFTHMEAEDIVRTLRELAQCCGSTARALFTYLPLEHAFGRVNFEQEMSLPHDERFSRVRNIAYTRDMAEQLMRLGGWEPELVSWAELVEPFGESGEVRTNQSWIAARKALSG
ncbi:MAG: methyltransferase domain protein [Frankiales bacterium]|nr:methyltransferase domain protein [Frankiales bacterium]